ncbi:glycosyl hydrolase [Massilia sp. R2A-15]|uniref:GH39 family glycosyl hydrolase n=1 Tax=Massilia sp. R2A-15 TaxID=3064278 RepID=UPI002735F315|nr:glycosyl hydrolase [Massilia sp. R2A-15]WLI91105.1 glycosyl hydrolase [Massilia sp. R2A-15]
MCDLAEAAIPLRHPWQTSVGSCHAPTALRADWQAQLRQARQDLDFRYVRFHGILCDDMGTLICQDEKFLYSFFNTDQIFDFLLSIGMRPIVELSFMPATLSSGGNIVFHYKANITPPKDYAQWGELVRRLVAHWVDRYGIDEVAQWYFEVWNEPNLEAFWTGGQEGYFKLYASSANAIKAVDPRLRVGGPATAQNAWIEEFLGYCAVNQLPVDFISTHFYPTDAFGEIGADTVTQLEHAPLDVMRVRALAAREQGQGRPLLYTEWNVTSNPRDPLHDHAWAAALAVRILMSVDDVVDAYSYWTFTDIFEENYFPSLPFHGGFGLMNLHGIPKPIYRAFQMLRRLGDRHHPVAQEHPTVVLWVGEQGADAAGCNILCINQAMPRHPIADETVALTLYGCAARRVRAVWIERIDEENCNPARQWEQMGRPEYLAKAQVAELVAVSVPPRTAVGFVQDGDALRLEFGIPAQALAFLRVDWENA